MTTRYLIDNRGKKKAVLLDTKEYERLMDCVERLEDTLDLDEAVRTGNQFRDYGEIRKELQKAGKL